MSHRTPARIQVLLRMSLGAALWVVGLAGGRASAQPTEWKLDGPKSQVVVNVFRGGTFSAALHDHHFVPMTMRGQFTFDPQQPTALRGEVVADANSLREPHSELKPSDQEKVYAQLRGPTVLDAAHYPEIRFVIHGLAPGPRVTGERTLEGELLGDLTLRGVTRPLRIPVRARWAGDQLEATGRTQFLQSEFGIKPLHKALGAIQVQDQVTVELHVWGEPAAAPPGR
jgi:polyisoprenoid-binding protein YceI